MWGGFWFGADRQAHDGEVRNLDAPAAGWAAPIPEQVTHADRVPLNGDQAGEIEEFLARVYAHQQC